MTCRSGCPTQNCGSYSACLRGAGVRVAYCNSTNGWDATTQRKWNSELDAYKTARAYGIQPAGTRMHEIDQANRISDAAGKPYAGR